MMGNFQLQYTAQEELSIITGQALTESGAREQDLDTYKRFDKLMLASWEIKDGNNQGTVLYLLHLDNLLLPSLQTGHLFLQASNSDLICRQLLFLLFKAFSYHGLPFLRYRSLFFCQDYKSDDWFLVYYLNPNKG